MLPHLLPRASLRVFAYRHVITRLSSTTVTELEGNPGLYIHVQQDGSSPPLLAFTEKSPPIPEAVLGVLGKDDTEQYDVEGNEVFEEVLHEVVASSWEKDPVLLARAQHQKEGWIHVEDGRNPGGWGRIPDPSDIIGSLEVRGGRILPGSYQRMPCYRVVTRDGPVQLSDPLREALIVRIKEIESSSEQSDK